MNRTTVSIGVPAYNEEENIVKLISSILSQRYDDGIQFHQLIILSDGSTDSTVAKASSISNKSLKVIASDERKGKSTRMKELFELSDSNALVLIDADVKIDNDYCIYNLIKQMIDSNSLLGSGRTVKMSTGTNFDKIMDVSSYLQDYVKDNFMAGNSLYSCHGRLIGLDKRLYKNIDTPISSVANDAFIYLTNKQNGGKFKYVKDSIVFYKAPQNIADFVKQRRRFTSTPEEQSAFFGLWASKEYIIPSSLKFKALYKALYKHHIYLIEYILLMAYSSLGKHADTKSATWSISESTKRL